MIIFFSLRFILTFNFFFIQLKDVSKIVSKFSEAEDFGAYAIVMKRPNSMYPTSLKKKIESIAKEFKCKFVAKKIIEV